MTDILLWCITAFAVMLGLVGGMRVIGAVADEEN